MRLPAPAGPALLEQPGGRLVQKEDYVGMRAQDAGLRPGVDVAVNGIADGFGLIGAGGSNRMRRAFIMLPIPRLMAWRGTSSSLSKKRRLA